MIPEDSNESDDELYKKEEAKGGIVHRLGNIFQGNSNKRKNGDRKTYFEKDSSEISAGDVSNLNRIISNII